MAYSSNAATTPGRRSRRTVSRVESRERPDCDLEAFERILAEALERYAIQLFAFQLMPNHWHFVLRPNQDGEMSRFYVVKRLGLESTLRPRGRPQTRFLDETPNKES